MNVLHVLGNISGTTIPVEIASATDRLPDTNVSLVSKDPLPQELPDTVENDQVLTDLCGFDDFSTLLHDVGKRYDIVHTHTVAEAAKVGYHAIRQPIHHVNTQHGHLHYTREEKVKNIPGLLLADTIIYNSQCTSRSYNLIEKALKSRANEYVVHNGVNIDAIQSSPTPTSTSQTVVTATRLIKRKNLGTLIRAIAHTDNISLRIIGDGPYKSELQQMTRKAGVESRVEFLGYLPDRQDVYAEIANGDVFALPSHGEGFCVAVTEGMAVGLPVVVSDIPIFHEVVGDAGVFVDRTDPVSIANALRELLENPQKAQTIGEQNRTRIREEFTLEDCARGYRDVYRAELS
ncbi:glycosyltransferase family 4 protein [Halovenus rubra]|uniref:Glycosyltransferase family 4 protein n=2 Tax=Halovenus rubra TaxID=869890 RepID=A0ABD5X1S9_9EURY|nr:glycosyltransferase family 4 protein [Halovenus rubra]